MHLEASPVCPGHAGSRSFTTAGEPKVADHCLTLQGTLNSDIHSITHT